MAHHLDPGATTPLEPAIPFCRTVITDEAQAAAVKVLRDGWVTMGRETVAFEADLADWLGARHAVAVSSCTAALQLSLMALGLPAGSPVLTPTLTFCGAVGAIIHAGLRPVLVDADDQTLGVSPEGVARAARRGASAMVVQHMAGYPLDTGRLAAAAGISPQRVVEDAAHGLGAAIGGAAIGSESQAACFSFYATKNLPIGEGGAVTTTDPELAGRLRTLRLHGMSADAWRRYELAGSWHYRVEELGLKANFTDVQAAIGRAQLRALSAWQARRAELAARYDAALVRIPGIQVPPRPFRAVHAWHLYIVRLHEEFGLSRDETIRALAERGIGTSVHFIPVHHHAIFRRLLGAHECSGLEIADRLFPSLLSLPLYPAMTDEDVDRVCQVLEDLRTHRPHTVSTGSSRGNP
jgi:dTDP-4-amino-4,6-dideoxygalactose transaminase